MGKLQKRRRRIWPRCPGVVVRGRLFTQSELVAIRGLIRKHTNWGRTKLSQELCTLLDWKQPNGRSKERACRVALRRLESLGYLKLPRKLIDNGGRPPKTFKILADNTPTLSEMPNTVQLRIVSTTPDARLWNALIEEHHYLGLPTPVGRLLRYLILGDDQLLGAISFSESAWRIADRDSLLVKIGIDTVRCKDAVIGNNRFLILPSVSIRNLASRILSLALPRASEDWNNKFQVKPQFAETFVDPTRFEGTCYRAANWLEIGHTKGYAKRGSTHANKRAPKILFIRGLSALSHRRLELAARQLPKARAA